MGPGTRAKAVARSHGGEARLQSGPAAGIFQTQKDERRKTKHYQEELQNLVIYRRRQSTQEDIDENDQRSHENAETEVPTQKGF